MKNILRNTLIVGASVIGLQQVAFATENDLEAAPTNPSKFKTFWSKLSCCGTVGEDIVNDVSKIPVEQVLSEMGPGIQQLAKLMTDTMAAVEKIKPDIANSSSAATFNIVVESLQAASPLITELANFLEQIDPASGGTTPPAPVPAPAKVKKVKHGKKN